MRSITDNLPASDDTYTPEDSFTPIATDEPSVAIDEITAMPGVIVTASPSATQLSEPRRLSTGTYLTRNVNSGDGELAIDNGLDEDAVVLLVPEADPKKTLIGVYVGAEDSFTITGIPDGNYIVYDRIGLDWDSAAGKFTRSESSERFEDVLSFETTSDTYTSYELTLHKVAGGNADTYGVSDSNMPNL